MVQEKTEQLPAETGQPPAAPVVDITYYTDPLCCWSWALEPQWRRLRYEFEGKIKWRYRLGGLLPDWNSYNDPMNSVSKPLQMGPVWLEASQTSGMPIKSRVWFDDPPNSSYPACLAVKSVSLQSDEAAELYLRQLREAVMLQGRNIGKTEVLQSLARELEQSGKVDFDAGKFETDLHSDAARNLFREDLQQVRYHAIGRFPTITMQGADKQGIQITGYRPYEALLQALAQVAPELKPKQKADTAETYNAYWGQTLTTQELKEALQMVS